MIEVYLEVGEKRVFAMTRSWPGWGRSGRSADEAMDVLADYRVRYEPLVRAAGLELDSGEFDVIAEVEGGGATDFGAPGSVPDLDLQPPDLDEIRRQTMLLGAVWDAFSDRVAAAPETLRKGPRGGGRDTSKIVDHVDGAERAYAPKIGVRAGSRPLDEIRAEEVKRCLEVTERPEHTKWPIPYFIRRSAWHVTDHLWEIEDRSV